MHGMLQRPISVGGRQATRSKAGLPGERLVVGEHVPDGGRDLAGDLDPVDLAAARADDGIERHSHEPNELRMLRNQTTHVAPVDGSTSAISWRDNQCPLLPKPTC